MATPTQDIDLMDPIFNIGPDAMAAFFPESTLELIGSETLNAAPRAPKLDEEEDDDELEDDDEDLDDEDEDEELEDDDEEEDEDEDDEELEDDEDEDDDDEEDDVKPLKM